MNKQLLDAIVLVVMIAISIVGSVLLIIQSRKNRVLEKVTHAVRKVLSDEHTARRLYEEEQLQRTEGNREKKKLLYRIDEMLMQSGIRRKIPFCTTEFFIVFVFVIATLVFYLVTMFSKEVVFGVLATAFVVMIFYASLKVLLLVKNSKTEDAILHFANMIENYSRTTDDIVSIFGSIAFYMPEPLGSAVGECYTEIKSTGDIQTAFARLDAKVGNRHFSDLLQNIEVCSRHKTNYEAVIKGNKEIIKNYLSGRAIRMEMANAARLQIATLLGIGFFVCTMLDDMLEKNLLAYLRTGIGGKILLLYCGVICLWSVWKMITIGQEE